MNKVFGVASLGLFLLGVGILSSLFLSRNDWKQVEVVEPPSKQKTDTRVEGIAIDISGEVVKPGLLHLDSNARVQDALSGAGGLSANADREWVEMNINLAQKITDGMKIYIPPRQNAAKFSNMESINNSININQASLSELETLWGVGEARAKAIIDGRPYGSIDELVKKKILPKNVLEKNKEKLTI